MALDLHPIVWYNYVMELINRIKTMTATRWDAPTTEVYNMERALDINIKNKDLKEIRNEGALPVDEFITNTLNFLETLDEVLI